MEALSMFRRRLQMTRQWMQDFQVSQNASTRTDDDDSFEFVQGEDACLSNFGVESQDSEHPTIGPTSQPTTPDRRGSSRDKGSFEGSTCTSKKFAMSDSAVVAYAEHDMAASHNEAVQYELAGRSYEVPFQDFRSASRARHRYRSEMQKYYNYRAVKPGQVNQDYSDPAELAMLLHLNSDQISPEMCTVKMTKTLLFQEAQLYPRPREYHRRPISKNYWPWNMQYEKRMKERKHAGRTDEFCDAAWDEFSGNEDGLHLLGDCPVCL